LFSTLVDWILVKTKKGREKKRETNNQWKIKTKIGIFVKPHFLQVQVN
jgi:hypothetical protein